MSSSLLETRRTDAVEEHVLSILIRHPDLVESARDASADWFQHTENRELFTAMLESPTIEALRETAFPVIREHLERLEASSDAGFGLLHEREAALAECLKRLELRHVKDSQATYLLLLTEEDGLSPSDEIESQVNRINRRIMELQPMGRATPTSDMIS